MENFDFLFFSQSSFVNMISVMVSLTFYFLKNWSPYKLVMFISHFFRSYYELTLNFIAFHNFKVVLVDQVAKD